MVCPVVMYGCENESVSCSVMSDSLQPHGLQSARLLCPWNSPGKNTGVRSHSLLQIFLTQRMNLGFPHCRQILYHLSQQGSPFGCESWTMKKTECRNIRHLPAVVLEISWESLGQQDQTSQSKRKSTLNIRWKDWCWSWSSNTLVTWCKELTHWKRLWCYRRLRARREADSRGWDGWMASLTHWIWVWVNSGRW